jgi:hypothetical protein
MSDYYEQRQAMSRFTLGALLLTDTVIDVVKRELRRVAGVKVEADQLRGVLRGEVLKRDVLEGDKAVIAARQVSRAEKRTLRKARDDDETGDAAPEAALPSATA